MLVLSRKVDESIRISSDIEVVVQRISGNRVTIGILAPRDIPVVRGELDDYPQGPQETEIVDA
jgi:carbon storage regulator